MRGYLLLSLSIIFELVATMLLKLSAGFTEYIPLLLSLLAYGISFYCLGLTLEKIALSVAYAIWSGVGTAITAIISIIFFDEVFTLFKFLGIIAIIGGVVLLNLTDSKTDRQVIK